MARGNHLLSCSHLLRQRTQRLVEQARNDSAHGLVPRPIRIGICLPKLVKERLLAILHGRESIVEYDGIVGEVWSGWEKRSVMTMGRLGLYELTLSVWTAKGLLFVERFEVDRLQLDPLRWPVAGRVAWEHATS